MTSEEHPRKHARRRSTWRDGWRKKPLVAVCLAGAAAAAAADGTATAGPRPHPVNEPAAQARYASFYQQKVAWTPCGTADVPLQCTRVRVPLDRSRPHGAAISFAVNRHRATGARLGSVLLNPGGPGASGLDFTPGAVGGMDQRLVAAYDLVGWDPRGAGRSHPLNCPATADTAFAAVDSSPDTLRELLAYEHPLRVPAAEPSPSRCSTTRCTTT